MRILVLGGGGREHAIVVKLAESPLVTDIHVAPGNGGTASIATNITLDAEDGAAGSQPMHSRMASTSWSSAPRRRL